MEELPTLKAKIKELEEKGGIDSNKTIEGLRNQISEITELHEKKEKEWSESMESYKRSNSEQQAKNILKSSLMGIKWKSDTPEQVRNTYIETIQDSLVASSDQIDGVMVFKDKDGKVIRDENTLKPKTAEEIQKEYFKDMIDGGVNQQGTGKKEGSQSDVIACPGDVDTKEKLSEFLIKTKGFTRGSEKYNEWYTELSPKITKADDRWA